ncbi:MAG: 50S ribosomal protein L17 [Candidatus Omnitrophica bacterium]|nr:50S ribosomal protein L17 [Candidatus Omnitrophota bacterium]
MRHANKRSKLGMKTSHRKATIRNIVRSLIKYQRIEISLARAKEVRKLAEQMITLGKSDTVNARRQAYIVLEDRDLIAKLFKEVSPLFKNRSSGYTRIIPTGFRRGDGANMCILELTERKIVEKLPKKAKAGKAKAKAEEAKQASEAKREEMPKAGAEVKHKEPKAKTISKSKPTLDEERNRERAKSEDRKLADKRGFMKNLRGLFRKRGDF